MARSNSKDIRRPEDWFPPVNYNKPSLEDMDAAIAAAIAAAFPIAESAVTGLVADLAAKIPATRTINTTAPITGGGTLTADLTIAISAATDAAAGSMSAADKTKLDAISGTNTGDQTSIVGITGTKAQFDTAVTDGNILYVGDITQYTDEMARDALGVALVAGTNITITVNDPGDTITIDAASGTTYTDEQAQDAVGTILTDTATIDFTYNDGANTITADVKAGSIGPTQLAASGVTATTYGDATHVGQFTVDAEGRVTSASSVVISGAGAVSTNLGLIQIYAIGQISL